VVKEQGGPRGPALCVEIRAGGYFSMGAAIRLPYSVQLPS
jgi:hypothetical protein